MSRQANVYLATYLNYIHTEVYRGNNTKTDSGKIKEKTTPIYSSYAVMRNYKIKNKGDTKMQKEKEKMCEAQKDMRGKNRDKQKRFRAKKKEEGEKEFRIWVTNAEEKFLREIILPRLDSLGEIHKKYTERKNNV